MKEYGAFDLSFPTSKTRRGRVQEGGDVSPTIMAHNQGIGVLEPRIAAMRGRNPENPSDRTKGAPTEQRLEIGEDGTSNTLTSVQKDNLIVEPRCIVAGTLEIDGWQDFIRRVHDPDGISPTIPFCGGGGQEPKIVETTYRIRKLTERECWRLMGVKDEDYEKVAAGQSKSSMYHLAGDSIVTAVLMALFGELLGIEWQSKVKDLADEITKGE